MSEPLGYIPFPVPIEPPDSEPDAAPLVNPAYNAEWNKYLLGVVAALQFSATWKGDENTREMALKRARNLMDLIANAPGLPQFRQTEFCQLQVSFDSGSTWTTIFEQCEVPVSHFLIDNPSGTDTNLITPATSVYGIQIQPENASGLIVFPLQNTNAPLVDLYTHGTGAALNLRGDGSGAKITTPNGILLSADNYLILRVQSGDSEPTPNAAHRGAIYLFDESPDKPYYIAKNGASYERRSLVGPAGANGTNGTDGADGADGAGITAATLVIGIPTSDPSATLTETPDIQHQQLDLSIPAAPVVTEVTAEALPENDDPTVDLTTRPDGDLKLAFGIPAGATGAQGEQGIIQFPDLPGPEDNPITFEFLVPAEGCDLPWIIPAGYQIEFANWRGIWVCPLDDAIYHTTASGSDTVDTINDFPVGRMLANSVPVNSHGMLTGTGELQDCAAGAFVQDLPGALFVFANAGVIGIAQGYVIADVTITPTVDALYYADLKYQGESGEILIQTIQLFAGENILTLANSIGNSGAFGDCQTLIYIRAEGGDVGCWAIQWSGTCPDPHSGTSPGGHAFCNGTLTFSERPPTNGDTGYYNYWRTNGAINIEVHLTRHYD